MKLVNQFLRQDAPGVTWTSFVLSKNVAFNPHKDVHNEPGSQNLLVVLSHRGMCKGGDLWLEQPEGEHARQVDNGKTLRGIILPAQRNPVLFNPKKWHGTTPWSGTRVSISCFTTAKAGALDDSHQQQLQQLGFPVVVKASLSSPKPSIKGLKFTQGSDATDATTEVQGSQGSHEGQGSQDVSQLRDGFQG